MKKIWQALFGVKERLETPTFLNSKSFKKDEQKSVKEIDFQKIKKFINHFNEKLPDLINLKEEDIHSAPCLYEVDCYGIPTLNDMEFEYCVKDAIRKGWVLKRKKLINNGDGSSTCYEMRKIEHLNYV